MNTNKNQNKLGMAVCMLLCSSPGFSAESPTVYGKFRGFIENHSNDAANKSVTEVNSQASRFGIKGSLATDSELEAIYQAEWEIDMTDDSTNSGAAGEDDPQHLKSRNQIIGLESKYGEIIIGRYDTPLKRLKEKVVQFDDTLADSTHMMVGRTRANNIIQYSKESIIEGVDVSLMLIPGEEQDVESCSPCNDENNGLADSLSFSISYAGFENLFLGFAIDDSLKSGSSGLLGKQVVDVNRLVAQYQYGDISLAAQYQVAEEAATGIINPDQETANMITAKIKRDKYAIKLQLGKTELEDGSTNKTVQSKTQTAIGVDYPLSDKITAMVLLNNFSTDTAGTEEDERAIATGLQVVF